MIMSDFISISPLMKSAVKSQAAYYFRKLLTHWLLLLVFDFCINVEIWFPQLLNAKQLRVSLAPGVKDPSSEQRKGFLEMYSSKFTAWSSGLGNHLDEVGRGSWPQESMWKALEHQHSFSCDTCPLSTEPVSSFFMHGH